MVSYTRAKEVAYYAQLTSCQQASEHYGISLESVKRYERVHRLHKGNDDEKIKMNVLFLDIETAPIKANIWNRFPKYVDYSQIDNDWFILGWSASWLDSNEVFSSFGTPEEIVSFDDERVCEELFPVLNSADIIVAHNGKRFDIPKINARFVINSMFPPTPFRIIDTYIESRKVLGFTSQKLDDICAMLGMEGKLKTGMKLWMDSCSGNQEAIDKMEEYCDNDVNILKDVYYALRNYFGQHPPIYLSRVSKDICPLCGSEELTKQKAVHLTKVSMFPTFRCDSCGNPYIRGRSTISSKPSVVKI